MKELLDGFSVERLEEIASLSKKELSDGTIIAPDAYSTARSREIVDLARIALAVKQAQPLVIDLNNGDTDAVKAAFAKGMDRYSGAMLTIAGQEDDPALQNFRAAMEGIGHIRRTLEETFGGLHGTHCEPDVLVECKAICDAICDAYRTPAPVVQDLSSIKRYDLDMGDCDSCGQDCGADMSEEPDGDYVLFADVVSLLTSAPESGQ